MRMLHRAMGTRWIYLLFGGLMMASLVSSSFAAAPAVETIPSMTSTQQGTAIPPTRSRPDDKREQPITSSVPISIPLEPALQQSVIQAKGDLARRLGVSADSITVDAVIGQDFSADAFYCRTSKDRIARDESPAVISGQTILLSVSGRRYEYHASAQTVIFCRPLP